MGINEFISDNYFLVFYALALIISLFSYRKYFDTVLKYLPILIGYTLITEILGFLIRDYDTIQIVYIDGYSFYNNLIFNIFDIIFFLYFFYVFWSTITDKINKKVIKWGAILFVLISLFNPFSQDFVLFPQIWASSFGSIILIACILYYYNQLRRRTPIPKSHDLLFWISTGLLVFYTFYPFILIIGHFDYGLYQKLHIHHLLIVVMYSCFILGFILMSRKRPTEDI